MPSKRPFPTPILSPGALRPFWHQARDHEATEDLMRRLAGCKDLTKAQWDQIIDWKLATDRGSQRPRIEWRLLLNSEEDYQAAATDAFAVSGRPTPQVIRARFVALRRLDGIGIGIASAVLALVEPNAYCVIDPRGWRALFGEERKAFSERDYIHYREEVQHLADALGWTVQETDEALWTYDSVVNGRPRDGRACR